MSMQVSQTAPAVAGRVLREGYGPGSWHGPDLKAAVSDVTTVQAYWRPGLGHNIAEIALHHAYYVRSVRTRIAGGTPDAFPLEGEDWFALDDERRMSWHDILALVEREQQDLGLLIEQLENGAARSALATDERFDLVLGITCHAVYHAGQIQLLKRLQRDQGASRTGPV